MPQVAPSILAANFAHLQRHCRAALPQGGMLHFDVMDGVFVPNISVGLPVLKSLRAAMPEMFYDVHLMIVNPAHYIDNFAEAGANGITIHCESEGAPLETLACIRQKGLRAGISLRPGTPVQAVYPLLKAADLVLVMSVEPGFGGQAFLPDAPARIAALRTEAQRQGREVLLQVDGGINLQTAAACARAGADILVAGSAVFGAQNPAEMVRKLAGR